MWDSLKTVIRRIGTRFSVVCSETRSRFSTGRSERSEGKASVRHAATKDRRYRAVIVDEAQAPKPFWKEAWFRPFMLLVSTGCVVTFFIGLIVGVIVIKSRYRSEHVAAEEAIQKSMVMQRDLASCVEAVTRIGHDQHGATYSEVVALMDKIDIAQHRKRENP